MALLPIDTAPKDRLILLYFPPFLAFTASWWTGHWSYMDSKWVIRTPFVLNEKIVMISELPEPIGWQEFPDVP